VFVAAADVSHERICWNFARPIAVAVVAGHGGLALVRIPLKPATHSTRNLPPVPRESCHPFHGKAATHPSEATGTALGWTEREADRGRK